MATILLDLLTETEERIDQESGRLRFEVNLLAGRLLDATAWLSKSPELKGVEIGIFGAGTGAAAALIAAARMPQISTVVSRGGRPDLAGTALENVTIPVLLIVRPERIRRTDA
jgi:putative phosphoribosyl transferase